MSGSEVKNPVQKSEEEWRKQLTPEQYHVAREAGTERAFTGKYWDNHDKGMYACVCCGEPLFTSDTKFDSEMRGQTERLPRHRTLELYLRCFQSPGHRGTDANRQQQSAKLFLQAGGPDY